MNQNGTPTPGKGSSFMKRHGSSIGFLAGMALLGFLSQFQWLGYVAITIYIIAALLSRIPARITFISALLALGMVPLAIIMANWLVAQNFAAYAFVLFVFGVVNMTTDLTREIKQKK